jgi:hypothetical protein
MPEEQKKERVRGEEKLVPKYNIFYVWIRLLESASRCGGSVGMNQDNHKISKYWGPKKFDLPNVLLP